MGKKSYYQLDVPMFNHRIYLVVKPHPDDIRSIPAFKDATDMDYRRLTSSYSSGSTTSDGKNNILVCINSTNATQRTIPHECVHVATQLLERINAPCEGEVFAYMVGYFSQWCLNCINEGYNGKS